MSFLYRYINELCWFCQEKWKEAAMIINHHTPKNVKEWLHNSSQPGLFNILCLHDWNLWSVIYDLVIDGVWRYVVTGSVLTWHRMNQELSWHKYSPVVDVNSGIYSVTIVHRCKFEWLKIREMIFSDKSIEGVIIHTYIHDRSLLCKSLLLYTNIDMGYQNIKKWKEAHS